MSLRHGGEQMPGLMKRFMGRGVYQIYNIFVCLLNCVPKLGRVNHNR